MRSARKDARYRRAKAEGYRARSAYKLIELDERHRVLARARRVLDVGAWPGSWLQVAAERAPAGARIVGVDLEPLVPLPDPRVRCLTGDITDPAIQRAAVEALGGPADVLLCDAAPKLTGVAATDEARLEALGHAIIEAATTLLAPGGTLVMKLFAGAAGTALRRGLAGTFERVSVTRVGATRRGSSELYAIATGRR